jgi:hypothetical protein
MNAYINPFTVQVAISASLLAVCLTNVLTKPGSDLEWERAIIASIFSYWISPPTQKK